ncbi:MAG: N-acyl homoserine lactonase family protein [bacterium]|nr:N-acyl homoserine lactonase family protein [bacterium]MDE0601074.1 N-acyl homoserine lactonase family protein [bacterium]
MAAHRMFVLPTGTCYLAEFRTKLGGSNAEVGVPLPMFAIDTDDGWVVFDTGCDPEAATDPEATWGRLAKAFRLEMSDADHPVARLAEAGIAIADVAHVVVSHLHMDHAGGIRFFPDATVHLQVAERRWAQFPDRFGAPGFISKDFDRPEITYRYHEGDAQVVPGVHAVLTDGHTPGHQSLVVDLPSGRFVLTGDAAYRRDNIDRRLPPPTTTDEFAAIRSLARLKAFEDRDNATILVAHDIEQWETTIKSPDGYYE